MTGRRRPTVPHTFRATKIRALCTALAGASLLAGCGALPGTSDNSRQPVTVMTWAPVGTNATNQPGMPAMAKAFARWVNDAGGIDGHQLRIVTCNEGNTAAGAATCAREAVDKDVAAVVGSYSQFGQQFLAPLEGSSIPYLGGYGLTDEEFSSFVSYPVNGGQATLLAGNGKQLSAGCEKTALVRPDTVAGLDLPSLLDAGLAQGRRPATFDIRAPEDATEYTGQAEKARDDAEDGGCVTTQLGDRTETFVDSYRRLPDDGRDIRLSSVIGSVDQPLIDSTGGKNGPLEGALVTGWYPESSSTAWRPMRDVIDKEAFGDNSIDPDSTGVQTTWIAYTALKKVIESIDDNTVTARKIMNALSRGVTVDTGGLTPPLRWRYEDMLGAPGFPRIVNSDVTFQEVRQGRLVAQRKGFVDVGGILAGSEATP